MLMAPSSISLLEFRLSFLRVFQPSYTLKAFQSLTAFFYKFSDTKLGSADTKSAKYFTMSSVDDPILREVNMLEIFELFEKRRKDIERFFLNYLKRTLKSRRVN